MKSLKNMPESLGDCGRLGNLYAILLENNISMMSQLSLNLGYSGLLSFAFMLAS